MNKHTNAFVDLNSFPYLLAEYVDKETFQQVDRALIKSEINIDTSEAMRAVIDVSIDDIGKRASDGLPNVIGNKDKQDAIINMINSSFYELNHHLPVLKRGIVIRVYYQLENRRTGQVIRTMTEDLRITNRNYFIDITGNDINNNALIVNFSDTMVSTINQFTHGRDPMMFRITSIEIFYECVRPSKMKPKIGESIYGTPQEIFEDPNHMNERDMYYYHKSMQNRHFIGDPIEGRSGGIVPHSWYDFNRFYHFDEDCNDIILHEEEILDRSNRVLQYSCGKIRVNRIFQINPGHRIIFKFSIWKNDVALFDDCKRVAVALNIKGETPCPSPTHDDDYEKIMEILRNMQKMDYRQNNAIEYMNRSIQQLYSMIYPYPPFPPYPPEPGPGPVPPSPHDDKKFKLIMKLIKKLQGEIDDIKEHGTCNPIPISDEEIQEILDNAEDETDDVPDEIMDMLDRIDAEIDAEQG